MNEQTSIHVPVLLDEVVRLLNPQPGDIVVDGTLGGGGHARALAERIGPQGRLIALDRDAAALRRAEHHLAGLPVTLVHADYRELPEVLDQLEIESVNGILLDLGLSSDQLADAERGFSFQAAGPLDLRFDRDQGEPAWRLLQRLSVQSLADLFYRYGEERYSRRIARKIVEHRRREPIRTADQLARIIRSCVPRGRGPTRIDPATRVFQALRIAVNDELGALEAALNRMPDVLVPGGRLGVITFHSLEDRLVKCAFRDDPRWQVLTRRPVRPSEEEVSRNPRARSAKFRVAARAANE